MKFCNEATAIVKVDEARKTFAKTYMRIIDIIPAEWRQVVVIRNEEELIALGGNNLRVLAVDLVKSLIGHRSDEEVKAVSDYLDAMTYLADKQPTMRPMFPQFRRYDTMAAYLREAESNALYLMRNPGESLLGMGFPDSHVFMCGECLISDNEMMATIFEQNTEVQVKRMAHACSLRDPFFLLQWEAEALCKDSEYREMWFKAIQRSVDYMGLEAYRWSIMNSGFSISLLDYALYEYSSRVQVNKPPFVSF